MGKRLSKKTFTENNLTQTKSSLISLDIRNEQIEGRENTKPGRTSQPL